MLSLTLSFLLMIFLSCLSLRSPRLGKRELVYMIYLFIFCLCFSSSCHHLAWRRISLGEERAGLYALFVYLVSLFLFLLSSPRVAKNLAWGRESWSICFVCLSCVFVSLPLVITSIGEETAGLYALFVYLVSLFLFLLSSPRLEKRQLVYKLCLSCVFVSLPLVITSIGEETAGLYALFILCLCFSSSWWQNLAVVCGCGTT